MINFCGNDKWSHLGVPKINMQQQWVHEFNDNFIQDMLTNSIAKMANQR